MESEIYRSSIDAALKELSDAVNAEDYATALDARIGLARLLTRSDTGEAHLNHLVDFSRGRIHQGDEKHLGSAVFGPISATASLQLVMRELQPILSRYYPLGFVSGSLAYSPYVKMRDSSDIDLTLIAEIFDPRDAKRLPFENTEEIAAALDATSFGDTAQVCVRTVFRDKQIAIHFTPRCWYDRVSSLDVAAGPTPHRVRRITERPEVGVFPGRFDFCGRENTWQSATGVDAGMYFIDQEDFQLDSDGRYVNGVLIDMLAISRFYFGDSELYRQNRLRLLSRLSARYHDEKRLGILHAGEAKFTNIFYCHNVFADFYEAEFGWCG